MGCCASKPLTKIKERGQNSSELSARDQFWDISGSDSEAPLIFHCDDKGIILDVNANVTKFLLFKRSSLLGEFVGQIMTPFMYMMHREIFLNHYKTASKVARNSMDARLSSKTKSRPLIIYNVNGHPVFVNLSLISKPRVDYTQRPGALPLPSDSEYYFRLCAWLKRSQDESRYVYSDSIEDLAKSHQGFSLSKNNIVIICIDFVNSTELLQEKGPINMAFINKRFYDDIVQIITHHFYPYLCVHEIVGDSFVLVLNADWTYNLQRYCTVLAINFINRLYRCTEDYVSMRVGISYGKVIYGFIGPTLRFFGNPMHVASRLEGYGGRGKALVNVEFYDKLCSEVATMNEELLHRLVQSCKLEKVILKGYGERECYNISLAPDKNDLVEIPTVPLHEK